MNLRNLSDAQMRELCDLCERIAPLIRIAATPRSCNTCLQWSAANRRCMHWDAEPPAEVRSTGCESWEYDEVPF